MTGIRLAANVEPAKAVGLTIYVNAVSGNDSNDGRVGTPFKSITKGMDVAISGQTVFVAPGMYSELYTSERLPIILKSGVILQGAGDSSTFIQGINSCSIVTASNVNASAKIDGFLILGGESGLRRGDIPLRFIPDNLKQHHHGKHR